MTASAVGQCAYTISSRDLLIDEYLWESSGSGPDYITPYWTEDKHPRHQATLWQTGSEIVGISVARHSRPGAVMEVCRRAYSLTSIAAVAYNDDGSVTRNIRRMIDDSLRAGMRAEVEELRRFNHR